MDLIIDTETTGLTNLSFATERNYQQWPRLVQIAWGLVEGESIVEANTAIVRPRDFIIPDVAEKIHGIGQERAMGEGCELKEQLSGVCSAMRRADFVVAHNIRYDLGVIQSEAIRIGFPLEQPRKIGCTAIMGKAYFRDIKKVRSRSYPKLNELHLELFGSDFAAQHDALSDVMACAKVYSRLRSLGY